MMKLDIPGNRDEPITVHYNDYADGAKVGVPKTMEVDLVIGADGANSRVAKDIDAGECDYAIAFQVRPGYFCYCLISFRAWRHGVQDLYFPLLSALHGSNRHNRHHSLVPRSAFVSPTTR